MLVVEDAPTIGCLSQFVLEKEGYAVILASDGRQAASRIETLQPPPALALPGVMLPCENGFQLIRRIRARPDRAQVPVVMLTAKSQERDIVRALDSGATDYLVKPFQPQELAARLRRLLLARRP